jgi:hypothetical protein
MPEHSHNPPWDFLSQGPDAFTPHAHKLFAQSFDFAKLLSDLGMRALKGIEPATNDNQQFIAAVLFGRALTSFQAAYILTERGLVTDARGIVRNLVETSVILEALIKDKGVIDLLESRHYWHRRKLLNSWLTDPEIAGVMSQEARDGFKARIAEIDALDPTAKTRGDPVNIAALAQKCSLLAVYNTVYRMHSGDSAHTTFDALERHVHADDKGEVIALSFGPELDEIPDTLAGAISCILSCLRAVVIFFGLSELDIPIAEALGSWQSLGAASDTA